MTRGNKKLDFFFPETESHTYQIFIEMHVVKLRTTECVVCHARGRCSRADECGSSCAVYSQHIKSSDSAASTDGDDSHRSYLSRMYGSLLPVFVVV